METMHSKLIRLQTALLTLALLFTVLIPVSAYAEGENTAAQATADGTTISDPNTFNAWEYTQRYNNATTGRIWADKTVEEGEITFSGELKDQPAIKVSDTEGADFLVALSALSSYASTTTTNTQALDIVMVLDASGSMDETMSDGTKRIAALKSAVNNFIDSAKTQNAKITDTDKKIKLSIVKFAGNSTNAIGNDTYRDGWYTYNYSQIVKGLTVCDDTGAAALKTAVSGIRPAGATRADLGLKHAQTVLKSPRPNAKQVVIFFTDGEPNNSNGFDMTLLPMPSKRLNPSRMRVPWFTRSAFLTVRTRTPMSTLTELQKQTSICRRSPATTPLPLTRNPKEPGTGTSATDLTMQITIWRLPALMG